MVAKWKKQVIEQLPEIFSSGRVQREEHDEALRDHLYQQIGQLKVELDWLKKNLGCSVRERLRWIEPKHRTISIKRQCELAALSRSSYYRMFGVESALNLELMRVLDELYTEMPYYGIRRMSAELRTRGYAVNHKRVARLLCR